MLLFIFIFLCSTKDLGSDGFSDHDDDMGDDDDEEDGDGSSSDDDDDGGGGGSSDDDDNEEEDENDEEERDEIMEQGNREKKDIQSFSDLGIESEMAKGKAVQSQLGEYFSLPLLICTSVFIFPWVAVYTASIN